MPSFSLENQQLGSALATDKDVDLTAGERDNGRVVDFQIGLFFLLN